MSQHSFRRERLACAVLDSAAQTGGCLCCGGQRCRPIAVPRHIRAVRPHTRSSFLTADTGSVRCWLLKGGTTMPRTDNDSWEITESVGSTALGVAAARAAETDSDSPLIQDPFARVFLNAAGDGVWNVYADAEL